MSDTEEQRVHTIKMMPLTEIQPWDRNPKTHDLPKIRMSISAHGFVSPLIMDEGTSKIVAGHGRLEALKQMQADGEDPPEGVQANPDRKDESWSVPVIRGISFPDPERAEAYLVADNRLTEAGGWDQRALGDMLKEMEGSGLIELAGFDMDDFETFMDSLGDMDMEPEGEFEGERSETPEEAAARAEKGGTYVPHRQWMLLLLDPEHEVFKEQVKALREHYDVTMTKFALFRAVALACKEANLEVEHMPADIVAGTSDGEQPEEPEPSTSQPPPVEDEPPLPSEPPDPED